MLKNAVEKQERENPKLRKLRKKPGPDLKNGISRLSKPLKGWMLPGASALPAGITPEELDARRRDLEQIDPRCHAFHQESHGRGRRTRKTLEASRAASAAWKGFEQKPPYSLLMVDELLNERDAIKEKLTSYESSLLNYQSILASTVEETKAAENAVSA